MTDVLLRAFPDLLYVHHGHSLLVTDRRGEIAAGLEGLYERDLRLLSRHRLLVHGERPRLDAISAVDAYSTLAYYVCPAEADGGGERDALGLAKDEADRQVLLRVARFVGQGMREEVELANHGLTAARLEVAWELAADFADLIEARGGKRQQEAPVETTWRDGALRFDYRHPRLPRGTLVHPEGADFWWDGARLSCQLELAPRASRRLTLAFSPVVEGKVRAPLFERFGAAKVPSWRRRATRIETPNLDVTLAWERAVDDLAALALGDGGTSAERGVPAAGVPLYGTLFGRDALTAAGQALIVSSELAEGALRLLARHLGTKDDDFHDEQPGRVPQQVRDDPLALLGIMPWSHDYGDYAAPCAFLVLLGGHHVVAGDAEITRELLEPAKRVLDWLETRADLDGDGFLEYKTRSPKGQKHQGWKDSGNGVVDERGRQVDPPIAPCEIQGYWYAAKLLMAEVFLALGEPARALDLYRQAEALKQRFAQRFWMEDERFVAFGLGPDKQQIRSVASNAGHCLATGIVDGDHARDVARRLLAPDMFSGWGIRTLSADNPAYNPFKYHLGCVWPPENATAAFGMKRYGLADECNTLCRALFDAAGLFEHHRLPEAIGGHPRDADHPHPGIYPDACAPQAWSGSAVFWLVQAMLGLVTYAPLNVVLVDPSLPEWLPEVTLRGMRVKDARVSIRFRRGEDGRTDFDVIERHGTVHVLRQPTPNDPNATPLTRLRDLVESLLP